MNEEIKKKVNFTQNSIAALCSRVSGKKLKMALLIRLDAWSQQVKENQRNVSTALHSGDTGATNTKGSCEAYTLKIKDEVGAGTDLKDIA